MRPQRDHYSRPQQLAYLGRAAPEDRAAGTEGAVGGGLDLGHAGPRRGLPPRGEPADRPSEARSPRPRTMSAGSARAVSAARMAWIEGGAAASRGSSAQCGCVGRRDGPVRQRGRRGGTRPKPDDHAVSAGCRDGPPIEPPASPRRGRPRRFGYYENDRAHREDLRLLAEQLDQLGPRHPRASCARSSARPYEAGATRTSPMTSSGELPRRAGKRGQPRRVARWGSCVTSGCSGASRARVVPRLLERDDAWESRAPAFRAALGHPLEGDGLALGLRSEVDHIGEIWGSRGAHPAPTRPAPLRRQLRAYRPRSGPQEHASARPRGPAR